MGNVLFDFMVSSLYGSFLNAWLHVKNYLQGKWRRLVLTLVNKFPLCTKFSSISMISFSHFLNLFFIPKKGKSSESCQFVNWNGNAIKKFFSKKKGQHNFLSFFFTIYFLLPYVFYYSVSIKLFGQSFYFNKRFI
jgi:hypothetical protein